MKSRESSSFTLSSTLLHIFPRDRSRHGNVRKGRRSSLPICSTHLRGRESRITAGKGSKERKLEELDSDAKNYEASGILPSKRVSFSQLRSPYSKCLPSVFFNRSPLFLPVDSQPRLWGDRSFHVVTAVISTDYILVRDLLLQRFHPIRGHVVSNLGTETARFSSRFVNE